MARALSRREAGPVAGGPCTPAKVLKPPGRQGGAIRVFWPDLSDAMMSLEALCCLHWESRIRRLGLTVRPLQ